MARKTKTARRTTKTARSTTRATACSNCRKSGHNVRTCPKA